MKIIYQIAIIFSICWVSQVIEKLLPIDFPASVIGMILLFLLLSIGVLKIEHIREKSDFLLANMAFFFIPAGVSVINYFDVLKSSLLPLLAICVITTVVTFAATAYSIKLTLHLMRKKENKDV
ncbi:CidA/LrgA family protein [Pseudoflavonifractor sp. MSJ-37]|uniref:CidA/LrgA family protein n=1 Tax=Pseudoflavonifractor sp. MSJ-37 TaxID=2841531 RepID=UPI001C10E7D4|nr:CidA/LrgA family protein [Pseudoflavonifractor sp. MSJ-37]MBU5435728.1 CidA/LrgA family protein [Pseudoflavonifractor sp. MSJ-37]